MKTISKWIRIQDKFIALSDDNLPVGYAMFVKPIIRPPERVVERFE